MRDELTGGWRKLDNRERKTRDHSEDNGVDRRIILRLSLNKYT
jgi:hypothetical protein